MMKLTPTQIKYVARFFTAHAAEKMRTGRDFVPSGTVDTASSLINIINEFLAVAVENWPSCDVTPDDISSQWETILSAGTAKAFEKIEIFKAIFGESALDVLV